MKLDDLRVFVYVAKSGSFSSAAKTLGIPATTLARRVQQFETDIGVVLHQRTTQGIVLTEAGENILAKSAQSILELDDELGQMHHMVRQIAGNITLAAPRDFVKTALTELIKPFMDAHPDVTLSFVSEEAYAKKQYSSKIFYEDGVDLAFRFGPQKDSTLIARKVSTLSLELYASREYLESRGMPEQPEQLASHDMIGYSWLRQMELEHADGSTFNMSVEPRVQGAGPDILLPAVSENMGIILLPSSLYQTTIERMQWVKVLPDWKTPDFDVYLVYAGNRLQQKHVRAFIDYFFEKKQA